MKNLFFPFLLCLCLNGFSQQGYVNGYVVKNSGDTLRGQIYSPGWDVTPKQIQFRNGNSVETQFSVSQLKSFSITGVDNYISAYVAIDASPIDDDNLLHVDSSIFRSDSVFLQVVVTGPASLYYIRTPDQKQHYFIGKNNSINELIDHRYKVTENAQEYIREDKKFIGQLTYYLSDCPEMRSSMDKLKYSESSLQPFFVTYANCKGTSNAFIAKKNGVSAAFGLVAGGSLSNVTFKGTGFQDIETIPFNTYYSPTFGIKLDFYIVPKNKNYSLYDDLEFQPVSFTGHHNYSNLGVFLDSNIYKINVTYLFLNTMFRYYFGQSEWKPFINAGVLNAFKIVTNADSVTTVQVAPSGTTTRNNLLFTLNGRESGLEGGAGVMWKKLNLEARYIYWSGFAHNSNFDSNINTFQLLVGYQF